jgi:very-short-patch-repair endonuclease
LIVEALGDLEQLYRAQIKLFAGRCESPIEELFAAALVLHGNGAKVLGVDLMLLGSDFSREHRASPFPGTDVYVQAQLGAYRVDFLFDDLSDDGKRRFTIVELDGHDWHERTKEQASRDKKRDRALVTAGYRILRFTGSETFSAPGECLNEVIDAILSARREG